MSTAMKRKSPEITGADEVTTPTGRPMKKMRMTQSQKQALMDNLQLEITDRARKLRAQYALQAHDLRARMERRVNRIPISQRKEIMGELLERHSLASLSASPSRKQVPSKATRHATNISVDPETSTAGARDGRVKRTSHEGHYSDKENAPAADTPEGLKNPKRRGKAGASRVVSQDVRENDQRILSPKSLNSRTYPHSPFRAVSPEKAGQSYASRPTSPLKPSSPLKGAGASTYDNARTRPRGATTSTVRAPAQAKKTTANRAATGPKTVRSPGPRPATRQGERKNSTGTVSSSTSSGTTVMKTARTGAGARKATTGTSMSAAAAAKKPTIPRTQTASLAVKKTATTTARKTTAPAAMTEGSTAGRRALRKRV
ncbi:uncharacterized protein PFLUO_LOCUS1363 [Penicillium psychrofluorescens]|uniref:uncharacterized protein n=1 Tax=Penicillium psychrofluorescens TaxID=3158075 RepID=UPI003CCDFE3E